MSNEEALVRQSRGRKIADMSLMIIDTDSEEDSEEIQERADELFEAEQGNLEAEEGDEDDIVVLDPTGGQEEAAVETRKRKWLLLDEGDPDPHGDKMPPSEFTVSLQTFYGKVYPTIAFITEWLHAVTRHSTTSLLSRWLGDYLTPDPQCYITEHQIAQELIRDPRMRLKPTQHHLKALSSVLVQIFPTVFPASSRVPFNQLPAESIRCRASSEGCLRLHSIVNKYKPVAHHSARCYTGVRWVNGDVIPSVNTGPIEDLGVWSHEVVFKEYERDPLPPYICNGKYVLVEGAKIIRERGPKEVIRMLIELDDDVYRGCGGEMEREEYEEWLTKDLVVVVERKSEVETVQKLVAACVQEWRPGADPDTEPLCFIHWLGVSQDHRRQGIAESLFHLHTSTSATLLEVHRSNTQAISLYSKLSMVPIGSSRHDKDEPWNFMFRPKTTTTTTDDLSISPSMHDVDKLYPGVFDDLLS